MKSIIYILLLIYVLLACDKQKQTTKNLIGEWGITTYKLTDGEGLSEFAEVEGTMQFVEGNSFTDPGTYNFDLQYTFPSFSGSTIENGNFEVVEKGDYMNISKLDASNTVISVYKYRILVHTNTDLELEYSDTSSHIHTFIFKRN